MEFVINNLPVNKQVLNLWAGWRYACDIFVLLLLFFIFFTWFYLSIFFPFVCFLLFWNFTK